MRPRTAFPLVTTRAPIFFARSQSAALLMVASGAIVVTSVPLRFRMLPRSLGNSIMVRSMNQPDEMKWIRTSSAINLCGAEYDDIGYPFPVHACRAHHQRHARRMRNQNRLPSDAIGNIGDQLRDRPFDHGILEIEKQACGRRTITERLSNAASGNKARSLPR